MRVLVTGGSGFFGVDFCKWLLKNKRSVDIRIFDLQQPPAELLDQVEFQEGDIQNYAAIEQASRGVDMIFHAAAKIPISRAGRGFWDVNVNGTENALKAALTNTVGSFVNISSSSVYDLDQAMPLTENSKIEPHSEYSRSKYEADLRCLAYCKKGLNATIIRPRTMIGEGRAGIFHILFQWIRLQKKIYLIGEGDNLYQLISARDLSDACWRAARSTKSGSEIFNVGSDKYNTLREDLEALIQISGGTSRIVPLNATIVREILRVFEWLHISPILAWHYMTITKPFYFDTTKTKKYLHWEPQDSNVDMLSAAYKWYVVHNEEIDRWKGDTHRQAPRQGILNLLRYFS